MGDFPAGLIENSVRHGASVDSVRASSSPSDIFNIKYILVTECQLLSSGNLIQEGFIKNELSLNVKCELVMAVRGAGRRSDCRMYEWMTYVK